MGNFYSQREIEPHLKTPLSGEDIFKIIGRKIPIIKHSELNNYSSLEQLLTQGAFILMYEWQTNYGHWVCVLFTNNGKTIEFYDPYGYPPDKQKKFIPPQFWEGPNMAHLLLEAMDKGYQIEYNEHDFQKRGTKIVTTCGRWVGTRILLAHKSLKEFYSLFHNQNQIDSDLMITFFTKMLIGK